MIKNLRKKFIIITMCSVTAVLTLIIAAINIASFTNIIREADSKISLIALNGGIFPGNIRNEGIFGDFKNFDSEMPPDMSPESPFDTRYFTVIIDSFGNVIASHTENIAAISEETAQEYALTLFAKNKTDGFYRGYKYGTATFGSGVNYTIYVFLDCDREMSAFYSFLAASVFVSLAGLLLVFLLVMFLSKIALKPVIESYEKQKRFITDAGHEIKTPLTIIDAGADVLEMENGENEWTQSIKNQVKRLSRLTEKLIFLSKMEEESTVLNTSQFSLSCAAKEIVDSFEAVAETKGKILTMNISQNIIYNGDKEAIQRLFSILLDNAIKYSDKNGRINFSLYQSGKYREIKVYNTVDFIEKGKHDELFERFYRKDSSRNSKTGGYGIGLSSAKAIVTAHKGKISACSEDGKSIVFTILL